MAKIEIIQHGDYKFMFIDDYLWMWDHPYEKELQKDVAKRAFGDVLVAGYGFGLLTQYLFDNKRVISVTTIEKYQEVIDTMKKISPPLHGKIIIGDYYDLPEEGKFDCVIGDIWADIDARFLPDYVRFKNKAQKLLKAGGQVLGWGKDYFEYLLETGKSR